MGTRGNGIVSGAAMTPLFELPIPTTLDGIVTRNRGACELGLATKAEIDMLRGDIDAPAGTEKDLLMDWRFVAFRFRQRRTTSLVLLGEAVRQRGLICTSEIQVVGFNELRVRTRNSIYALTRAGEGEPPLPHLLQLCATLRQWGLGGILGVIEVW
jgi:hypothetical protein